MTVGEDIMTSPLPSEAPPAAPPRPYGFWATMGLSLLILVAYLVLVNAVTVAIIVRQAAGDPETNVLSLLQEAESNGFAVLTGLAVAGLLCAGSVLFFAWLRKGMSPRDYLGLIPVCGKTLAAWLGIVVGFLVLFHLVSLVIKPESTTEMYLGLYETAIYPAIFWIAIVVTAPVFEELFFRGFMFRGIEASRLGTWGAIVITALIWSGIHLQYEIKIIAFLFVLGILLGIARARHGSVTLTIALHMLVNLIAGVEIMLAGMMV